MTLPITDTAGILRLIPQHPPFVMVDALLSFSEQHLTASFTPPKDSLLWEEGKFSASGIIEHQAQSVALHTGYAYALQGKEAPVGYIGAIKQVEILALPALGDTIHTEVTIVSEFGGVSLVKISSTVNGTPIATAEMKTVVK